MSSRPARSQVVVCGQIQRGWDGWDVQQGAMRVVAAAILCARLCLVPELVMQS